MGFSPGDSRDCRVAAPAIVRLYRFVIKYLPQPWKGSLETDTPGSLSAYAERYQFTVPQDQ